MVTNCVCDEGERWKGQMGTCPWPCQGNDCGCCLITCHVSKVEPPSGAGSPGLAQNDATFANVRKEVESGDEGAGDQQRTCVLSGVSDPFTIGRTITVLLHHACTL